MVERQFESRAEQLQAEDNKRNHEAVLGRRKELAEKVIALLDSSLVSGRGSFTKELESFGFSVEPGFESRSVKEKMVACLELVRQLGFTSKTKD